MIESWSRKPYYLIWAPKKKKNWLWLDNERKFWKFRQGRIYIRVWPILIDHDEMVKCLSTSRANQLQCDKGGRKEVPLLKQRILRRDPSAFEWIRIHLLLNGRICKHGGQEEAFFFKSKQKIYIHNYTNKSKNNSVQQSTC